MVFSSVVFLFFFLPFVLLCYYLVPSKGRNLILFILSLLFYAWGEPIYILLMIFSTIIDYINGLLIERWRNKPSWSFSVLVVSLCVNLCVLGFFKYSDFLIENMNGILGTNVALLALPLPIGISFYTFQTMSYTIDVYRGEVKAQRDFLAFGTYVSLFPQLIAGPIVKYRDIDNQLTSRHETIALFSEGIKRFSIGIGKKVLLANNIGYLWNEIQGGNAGEMSIALAWLGIVAFAFQIYFDFSGYSDMAIGLAHMFGFTFPENFRYPYISRSITEFWRRWHISLGSWFREYVYIPLGGNRVSRLRLVQNILVVWMLTGIWHGASWNFLFWGLYFGILLLIEKLWLLKWLRHRSLFIQHTYTILTILFGWVLFAFENIGEGVAYIKMMFGFGQVPIWNNTFLYYFHTNVTLLVILIIASTPVLPWIEGKVQGVWISISGRIALFGILLLSVAYLIDSTFNPFLYFRF